MERWRVHKFGGSSVADAECMRRVAQILEQDPRPRLAVVLSACRGVTDALLELIASSARQELQASAQIDALRLRHMEIARALLEGAALREYGDELDRDILDIQGILRTVRLIRSASMPL